MTTPTFPPDPEALARWQRWARAALASPAPYEETYLPVRPAFTPLDGDVPVRRAGAHLLVLPGEGLGVFSKDEAAGGVLEDVDAALAQRVVEAVDGTRTVGDVLAVAASEDRREEARGLLQRLLGTVVVLPSAVASLAARLDHRELVRFPMQAAYAVPRGYWANAADVRDALPALFAAAGSPTHFPRALSRLHVLATMGAGGSSFHGGGGETEMVPGRYRTRPERTHTAHLGMVAYVRERLRALDLDDALVLDHAFESPAGAPLGRLANDGTAYEIRDADEAWMAGRLEELREALAALRAAVRAEGREAVLAAAAAFHHLFCHVHPFERINNSVAMNVVNASLREAGLGVLPHLLLDHFALRLDAERYVAVFDDAFARMARTEAATQDTEEARAELKRFRAHVTASDGRGESRDTA